MSKPELYYQLFSPAARAAYLVAKEIQLDFVEKKVNLMQGETFSDEFRKLNVTGTIPVLKDGYITIFDSHAIIIYLVEKYAKNDSLYPKNDLKLRTRINEILFYEASYLYPKMAQITVPIYFQGEEISQKKIETITRAYGCIESFLTGNKYVAGNQMTLADYSVWSTLEILVKLVDCDKEKYSNIWSYLERLRNEYPEHNQVIVENVDGHMKYINVCLEKHRTAK